MTHKALIFCTLSIAGIVLTGCSGKRANLSGRIESEKDTLLIQIIDAAAPKGHSVIDTVVLNDGYFETSIPDSSAKFIYLLPKPSNELEMMSIYPVRALFLPGDRMKVNGRLDEPEISGTELYDALGKTAYWALDRKRNKVHKEMNSLYADYEQNKTMIDSLSNVIRDIDIERDSAGTALVRNEPDNIASAFAAMFLPAKESVEAGKLLSDNVRNSNIGPVLDYVLGLNENQLKKEQNWTNLKPGSPAPDFRLKNLDGEYMSLASFKGKYILLDFWGTWCGWCIKGIPEMKEYYGKYKKHIEFVGIDCRDTEEKWREGVKEHGLPWTNLYNGNGTEIVTAYGIQGYPSKIIVDKEGKIVAAFIGESEELYRKLDELFK